MSTIDYTPSKLLDWIGRESLIYKQKIKPFFINMTLY